MTLPIDERRAVQRRLDADKARMALILKELESARAALREIGRELDLGEIMHGMDCQEITGPKCICSIAKIRAIVERAVGGES